MQLDVKWFISVLVENDVLTTDAGVSMYQELGGDPDLMTFAQHFLDTKCEGASAEEQQSWAEQIQSVIDYAVQQAESGAEPSNFKGYDSAYAGGVTLPPEEPEPEPEPEPPKSSENPYEDGGEIPSLRNVSSMSDEEVTETMKRLLFAMRGYGASDLHFSSNAPMFVRKALELERIDPDWKMPDEDVKRLVYSLLTKEQQKLFEEKQDISFGLQIGQARFRTALMFHKEGMGASYRLVPDRIRDLEDLGFLPEDAETIKRLLDFNNGLILVTGPLGSGKTTTLASMVDVLNETRQDHVITVEEPIEIIQQSRGCQITQREIGTSTKSYHAALKGALREDPDVIVIGEMHDLETIENAITASETGHLVIGTLHTCDAGNTMNRVLDVFPPSQQVQIRTMVAGSLRGVVCQRLVPKIGGGLTIVYEILVSTIAISNLIGEGKIYQLKPNIQIGSKAGMCTMDQNILKKFKLGIISRETALAYMTDSSCIAQLNQFYAVEQAKALAAAMPKKKK